jgi:transcriptional regulator with XRE-family HTH domain
LLAKKVEISVESIRQIERGLHDIDVVLLAKIAQALNSAMSQLVVSPRGPFRRQQ